MEETEVATALPDADNDLFFAIPVTGLSVSLFASADVGFVHFDSSVHHRALCLSHGSTNPVAEIPRRFVTDSQGTFDLVGAHPLARFAQQEHSHEPRFQRKMRIMEDRLRENAELIAAFNTLEFFLGLNLEYALALAAHAFDPERKPQLLEQGAALFVGREHLGQIGESHV
jgi:hypothetical protein